jgi:hypothetical protein
MKAAALGMIALLMSGSIFAKDPDCTYREAWPLSQAQGIMTGTGQLDPTQVDFKTSTITQIASQRISEDLYRQIQLVRFVYKDGRVIPAITTHDASHVECSESDVDTYPVLHKLGDRSDALGKPVGALGKTPARARSPVNQTPTALARAWLEAAKLTDAAAIDQARVTVSLMASQKNGKKDRLEVHRVRFAMQDGKVIDTIVADEVSASAHQTGKADVYVVSGRLDHCVNVPKHQTCLYSALPPPKWMSARKRKAIDDEEDRLFLQRIKAK